MSATRAVVASVFVFIFRSGNAGGQGSSHMVTVLNAVKSVSYR